MKSILFALPAICLTAAVFSAHAGAISVEVTFCDSPEYISEKGPTYDPKTGELIKKKPAEKHATPKDLISKCRADLTVPANKGYTRFYKNAMNPAKIEFDQNARNMLRMAMTSQDNRSEPALLFVKFPSLSEAQNFKKSLQSGEVTGILVDNDKARYIDWDHFQTDPLVGITSADDAMTFQDRISVIHSKDILGLKPTSPYDPKAIRGLESITGSGSMAQSFR